jgi:MerR family transcriptional regulator, Zn(II)-responsive regulator of zntA
VTTKIGAIAERLGTTVRTLRFYEERGLVRPHRSPKGTRLYDEEQEARFAALLALTRLGFSLEDLVRLTGVRPASLTGDKASKEVDAQLQAMDDELEAQALAIASQREDIRRAQSFLTGCHGCRRKPVRAVCDRCEVSAGWQDTVVLRVVWDEVQNG